MNPVEALAACAGTRRGTNTLQDLNAGTPEESPSTTTVTRVLLERFVRLDYIWGDILTDGKEEPAAEGVSTRG